MPHLKITRIVALATLPALIGLTGTLPAQAAPACTITGTAGDDTIQGTAGDDTICAGDGADFIDGLDGNDTIYGDLGSDTIYGGVGNDTIYGSDGHDEIAGDGGDDVLYGEAGEDLLAGDDGLDKLYGGDNADDLSGNAGVDLLDGAAGDDEIRGGAAGDTLVGGLGVDKLIGDDGADSLQGDAGADTLAGGSGADTLAGGTEADVINGGVGTDTVTGGAGSDSIDGGVGADKVDGGTETDKCLKYSTTATLTGCETPTTATASDAVASFATSMAPDGELAVVPTKTTTDYNVTVDGVQASLPIDPKGQVVLTPVGTTASLKMDLPQSATQTSGSLAQDGTVVYADSSGAWDMAVQAVSSGARAAMVLNTPSAPRSFTFTLDGPAGMTVTVEGDLVLIKDSAGNIAGGMAAPWAKDANGVPVPTTYTASGTTVTQTIHPDQVSSVAYPITADPYMGRTVVKSVTKASDPKGTIYRVKPTTFGRYAPLIAHVTVGWAEAKGKGVPNRTNLYEQYICHPDSIKARTKSTWNLDTWRPQVGPARTLLAGCNP